MQSQPGTHGSPQALSSTIRHRLDLDVNRLAALGSGGGCADNSVPMNNAEACTPRKEILDRPIVLKEARISNVRRQLSRQSFIDSPEFKGRWECACQFRQPGWVKGGGTHCGEEQD
jgi:hypothetical protein